MSVRFDGKRIYKSLVTALLVLVMVPMLTGCSEFRKSENVEKGYRAVGENDYKSGLAFFEDAITDGEQLELAWRGKGIALMGLGRYADAVPAFENALNSRSDLSKKIYDDSMDRDIQEYLACACFRSGDAERALRIYTELIGADAENADLYMLRGTVYAQRGNETEAKNDFNRSINLDRDNYERLYEIARILESAGMKDIGISYLQGAIDRSDDSMDTLVKGRFLCYLEKYDEAAKLLEQQTAADTGTVFALAQAYQKLDRPEEAVEILEKFQNNTGDNATLMALLGTIEMEQEHYEEALDAFERGLAQAAGDSIERQSLLFNRAVAYEYMGDFENAENYMAEYLAQYPDDEEAAKDFEFLKTR